MFLVASDIRLNLCTVESCRFDVQGAGAERRATWTCCARVSEQSLTLCELLRETSTAAGAVTEYSNNPTPRHCYSSSVRPPCTMHLTRSFSNSACGSCTRVIVASSSASTI